MKNWTPAQLVTLCNRIQEGRSWVKCVEPDERNKILEKGKMYKVAVYVDAANTHRGVETNGVILSSFMVKGELTIWPYVWDIGRFELYTPTNDEESKYSLEIDHYLRKGRGKEK